MRTCTYGIFNFPDFEACGKFTAVKLLNAEMLFRKAIQNALVGLHRRSVWAIAHLFIAQEIGVGYSVAKSNDARGRFFMQPCRHAACRIQYSEQDYEHCYIVICKGG